VSPRSSLSPQCSWFIFMQQQLPSSLRSSFPTVGGSSSDLSQLRNSFPTAVGSLGSSSDLSQHYYIYKNCCSSLSAWRTASKPINKLLDCKSKNDQNFLITEPNIVLKVGIDSKFFGHSEYRVIRYFPGKPVKLCIISLTIRKSFGYWYKSIPLLSLQDNSRRSTVVTRCGIRCWSSVIKIIDYLIVIKEMTRTFLILNQI